MAQLDDAAPRTFTVSGQPASAEHNEDIIRCQGLILPVTLCAAYS